MTDRGQGDRDRWARLRFAIIGPLLAAPPAKGQLQAALRELSARSWQHPVSGEAVRFGMSTLERWYSAEQIIQRSRTVPSRFSSTNTALRSA